MWAKNIAKSIRDERERKKRSRIDEILGRQHKKNLEAEQRRKARNAWYVSTGNKRGKIVS